MGPMGRTESRALVGIILIAIAVRVEDWRGSP